MMLPESENEYRIALIEAARLGAMKALEEANVLKPYLRLKEAKRKYGPLIVENWIRSGVVKPIKEGERNSAVRLSRIELEAAAAGMIITNRKR
ncbi:MAG: hypothetical protein GX459_12820 [Bacteroidales bacterium]|nr:hypothetical protein [Bacteroidales bacterium]